jgi:hypothetical protein
VVPTFSVSSPRSRPDNCDRSNVVLRRTEPPGPGASGAQARPSDMRRILQKHALVNEGFAPD